MNEFSFGVFEKHGMAGWIADDVIKSRLFCIYIQQDVFMSLQYLSHINELLLDLFEVSNIKFIESNLCFALSITIDTIIHKERIVIYNT